MPAAAAILHERHPSVDLRLTEAEPPEAVRMLRAGYVDVALVFRHEPEGRRRRRRAVPEPAAADDFQVATTSASRCCCPSRCT